MGSLGIRLAGAALVLLVLLSAGCDSSRRSPGPELLDEVDVEPSTTVSVTEQGFEPASISVEVGEAFEVTNDGDEPHSLSIDDPFVDTGDILPGESTVIVLTSAGTHLGSDETNSDATLEITVTEST